MLSDSTRRALDAARQLLDRNAAIAAQTLCDVPELSALGLDGVARQLARDPDVSRNDVRYLIVRLEAMDKEDADANVS
jgi:hypothetical protein